MVTKIGFHSMVPKLVAGSNGSTIVVTLDYRLNIFGFLGADVLKDRASDGSTGNYGIQDQRLALHWVREHIAAFGGSRDNVTIFGQSAGGNSVLNHLTQPQSFGLYSKAIIESGLYINACPMDHANDVFDQVLHLANCTNLECLLHLSAPAVSALLSTIAEWGPVVDGVALPVFPQALVKQGRYNKAVPVILGSNKDEYASFIQDMPHNMSEADFDEYIGLNGWGIKNTVRVIKDLFKPSAYSYPSDLGNYSRWWWEAMRVSTLGGHYAPQAPGQPLLGVGHCSVRCLARLMVAGGTPQVYTYEFARPTKEVTNEMNVGVPLITGPGNPFAPHASELEYVFAAYDTLGKSNGEVELARHQSLDTLLENPYHFKLHSLHISMGFTSSASMLESPRSLHQKSFQCFIHFTQHRFDASIASLDNAEMFQSFHSNLLQCSNRFTQTRCDASIASLSIASMIRSLYSNMLLCFTRFTQTSFHHFNKILQSTSISSMNRFHHLSPLTSEILSPTLSLHPLSSPHLLSSPPTTTPRDVLRYLSFILSLTIPISKHRFNLFK